MYIIEHDAKELLALRGVPVPAGCLVEAGIAIPAQLPSAGPWVVKGQITMGGRGKAGIIRKAAASEELERHVRSILGTTVRGRTVSAVRIEQQIRGAAELYLSLLLDAASGGVRVIMSDRGGVEIEAVPANEIKSEVAPLNADALAACVLRLAGSFQNVAAHALRNAGQRLARIFLEFEMQLIEINPLFVYPDGSWVAGDAKLVSDDNALPRQAELHALVESRAGVYPEAALKLAHGFDYVVVDPDGDIGLLTTGAGLSMMLIDELRTVGLKPYNFLDVRTGGFRGDPARLVNVLKWISAGRHIRIMLINIFAGITDLGEFSRLLVTALQQVPEFKVPVVARLAGNGLSDARRAFEQAGIKLYTELDEAIAEVQRQLGAA
ncbi:MAG TPA: ATP-grasp domain-containing protein [Burkholderiales bacterium]|nr:ATP-grasp domain-containing protein [Burkholderiales bacterium]